MEYNEAAMYNGTAFTETADIQMITGNSFLILEKYGVLVENEKAARLLWDAGAGKISFKDGRVRIHASFSEEYFYSLMNSGGRLEPSLSVTAEIYEGPCLDPIDGEYKPWSEQRLLDYIKIGKALNNVDSISMLGCPIPGLSRRRRSLYEKLYAFKYGTAGSYAIWETALCPQLLEIWQVYSEETGKPLEEVFQGCVFMISPLKMGHVELEQMLWFRERGLKVSAGILSSIGISAPVTPAGAIALHIAEQLFLSMLHFAFWGERRFVLNASLSVADMLTAAFQYGRPEQVLVNNAMSDIASYYGLPYIAHCGLSDAKKPSFEAGVQKTGSALAAIMKGRKGHIAAGLLSVDEVHSPVQMVLDNEAAGYLRRICAGFMVDENALAFDTLGGCISEDSLFIGKSHTAENFRACVWQPSLFSSEMSSGWDKTLDCDRAREKVIAILKEPPLEPLISSAGEQKIRAIIDSAGDSQP